MTSSQEIQARQGCPKRLVARLSDAALHSEIAVCERMMGFAGEAGLPEWRRRLYQALLAERYCRPAIGEPPEQWYDHVDDHVDDPSDDHSEPAPAVAVPELPDLPLPAIAAAPADEPHPAVLTA